ncbi:DUF4352 domain-containing protein [Streptomyces sp. CNZ748]|uniref:DUF4352 domain-containing protein n=1 Tax=Streptomyces sp. CNZ748 TaxID=2885160 RepID=UPI0027E051BA|nr:DUF4352 domain-containing protein [Streptomyces sp. CNZ748]
MTQPNDPNQPQQPQHQPYVNQQPHPPQPGYGVPGAQPPPRKKGRFVRFAGFGCAGVLGLVVVIAAVSASGDSDGGSGDRAADPSGSASASAGADEDTSKKEESARSGPVRITAERTEFSKTVLADGSGYTSVLITVANNGDDEVSVNPLYFTITDTRGTKHTAELGVDEKQIDTAELAPGENIAGTVTGKGGFTPKYVTYTDGLLGDPVRVDVS